MIDLMVVLTVLMGLAADEAPAQSGKSSKPSAPAAAAPAPAPVQEGERPALSTAEIKMLRDTNIFAPRSAKRKPPSSSPSKGATTPKDPPAPPKPKPPLVTGIFFDAKAQTFLVVVEDRNTDPSLKQFKEPKFLKTGDEVIGYKVAAVSDEKAKFTKGDVSKELKVGESLPESDGKPVSAVPATEEPDAPPPSDTDEIKPVDAEAKEKALEDLKKKVGKKNRPSRDE